MNLLDNAFGISPSALLLRSQRSEVLAANIANSETPNYLAKDFDFNAALTDAMAMGESQPLTKSDDQHFDISIGSPFAGAQYRVPTKVSGNGNTVEEEIEQAAFSQNAVQYQTSLQFLNGTISSLRLAIKGE
jgi:flagellar basal-body rod protein FlgB